MKKISSLFLALLLTLVVASGAYCAEGDEFSTTSFRVDGDGEMHYKVWSEIAATNDTITVSESGKVFFMYGATNVVMTLPAVQSGLKYEFVNGNTTTYSINPNGTDTLLALTLAAGDQLQSPATIGATVTVYASDDASWFVTDANVTFVDIDQ